MFETVVSNVLFGWLWRRAQELVGLATLLTPIYLGMSPSNQDVIKAILSGQGGGLSISAYIGLVVYLYGQWRSLNATTKPQVVTADGQKIAMTPDSMVQTKIDVIAKSAPSKPTLWEKLTGAFAR